MKRFQFKTLPLIGMLLFAMTVFIMPSGCSNDDDFNIPIPGGNIRDFHKAPTMVIYYQMFWNLDTMPLGQEKCDYRSLWLYPKGTIEVDDENHVYASPGSDVHDPTFKYQKEFLYPTEGFFNEMSVMNGDTAFVKSLPHYTELYYNPALYTCWIEDIIDLRITALEDYDSSHPAGASLNDIANVTYASAYDFVQQGYEANVNSTGNGAHPLYVESNPHVFEGVTTIYSQEALSRFEELLYHCKADDIRTRHIKMNMGLYAVSFNNPPMKECKVKVSTTVQLRNGRYPARTYTGNYTIKAQ